MSFGSKLTTDVVGLFLWPLAALLTLRIVKGADPRWWLVVGGIAGVAIEAKYTAFFFAAALGAGLLLLPQRRAVMTPWFLAGIAAALAITLPNFLWQAQHGYPMWTLLRDASQYKNTALSPADYVVTQALITHPLLAPVWLIGLVALLRRSEARFLGIGYLLLIAAMIVLHGKHYYPGDVYPIPIAAGAVTIERWTNLARWWRPLLVAYAFAAGVALVPLLMPILPERAMSAYAEIPQRLLTREVSLARTDASQIGNLPPDWADMHGWPELAALVGRIYRSLPPPQRAQAAIIASNYGEAAALDFFGSENGLPPVLSGHNQYWVWGTRGYTGNVVIDVHGRCDFGTNLFRARRVVARFNNPWGRPLENGFPVSLCEGINEPLASIWVRLRNYI
jgi:hypothetical protein